MTALRSFPPSAAPGVRVLILGSMPGEESQRRQQYYAHPRNAFWGIMGELFGFPPGLPYPERLAHLKKCRVALWDTLASCERKGSLDSEIRVPEPNDIAGLLAEYVSITHIFCNGTAAFQFLKRYHAPLFRGKQTILRLPSTSPAAARFSYEEKLEMWRIVLDTARADGAPEIFPVRNPSGPAPV